jgi:predicted TPR repeat methyltransferase
MKTAAAHYDTHLGPVYAWMLGDIDTAFARSAAEIIDMHLPAPHARAAVDLGAGLGLHSIPLAKSGFDVTAIDNCQFLLDQLRSRAGALPITVINADLLQFRHFVKGEVDVILCAGDTLTHLSSLTDVESLLEAVAMSLASGGMFVATFRDYVSKTLEGDDRFILVRRDENRIFTCFLEYAAEYITVHDLVTQREEGQWVQRVSSYPKLRLDPEWVKSKLTALRLQARLETAPTGMVRVVATKV